MSNRRKLLISLAIVLLAVLSFTSVVDKALSPLLAGNLDVRAKAHLNETLKRSLYTFAVARALNAAISTLQGTSLLVSPAGVGVNLTIGEILDPLNDLVEQFSWVMLLSATSLGAQLVLLQVGSAIGFKFVLTLALLLVSAGLWLRRGLMLPGCKLLAVALVVRLCIPLVALASEGVYAFFLSEKYERSVETLDLINREIKQDAEFTDPDETEKNSSWIGRLWDNLASRAAVKKALAELRDMATRAVDYIVDLIVVFVVQTIVIPLIVLWGLTKAAGFVGNGAWSASVERVFKERISAK